MELTEGTQKPSTALIASTARRWKIGEPDSFYKSAQWTVDGTTIITSSSSNCISAFVLPEDLLEPRDEPLSLKAQGVLELPEPTNVVAAAPYFSLGNSATQTVLVACKDHPIQMYHILPEIGVDSGPSPPSSPSSSRPSESSSSTSTTTASSLSSRANPAHSATLRTPPLANYNLIKPQTEEYLTPAALLWLPSGTHFVTGTANLLAQFDITRVGEGPIVRTPTIPSTRHLAKGGGVGMRGTVSALSCQPYGDGSGQGHGLVAAGTWTRWVGLYDFSRAGGECAATWSVASAVASTVSQEDNVEAVSGIGGQGVLQTIWSPCGRYLIVNERKSTALLVYDIRVTGRLLGWLAGRPADTHQQLSCDVFRPNSGASPYHSGSSETATAGFEVWGGTQDGTVAVWEGVGTADGCMEPSWSWAVAAKGTSIGATAMHTSGSVVATCLGSWTLPEEAGGDGAANYPRGSEPVRTRVTDDAGLRVWSVGAAAPE